MPLKYIWAMSILVLCLSTKQINKSNKTQINLAITDSLGYFLKKESICILIETGMTDTIINGFNIYNDSDTLGKYIFSRKSGNYVLCIQDFQDKYDFETHVLIELKPLGNNKFKIISKERYFHGNYSCCWDNAVCGFSILGDYFTFDCCGTGSSYCGTSTYYFQHVQKQKKLIPIPSSYWFIEEIVASELKSTKEYAENCLTYNYCYKSYTIKTNEMDSVIFSPDSSVSFKVSYFLKGNSWKSSKNENLLYPF